MKYLSYILIAMLLVGCSNKAEDQTTHTTSAVKATDDEHSHHITDGKAIPVRTQKTYRLTKLKTETIDYQIKVKDNDTIIYTEDTGHGIPTKPAGEGHQFHAILKADYKKLSMYMLDDGTFITADPKHVSIIKKGRNSAAYPHFKLNPVDKKYLKSLNHKDKQYKNYIKYVNRFGTQQFDDKRELLMFTAIHKVNGKTESAVTLPDETFKSFESFKKK